jgi:hypothetical protein
MPVLIRHVPQVAEASPPVSLARLIPAWIVSGIVHVVLLSLFLLVTVSQGQSPVSTELSVIESKVDEVNVQDKNLTNEDIGNDPDLPTNPHPGSLLPPRAALPP